MKSSGVDRRVIAIAVAAPVLALAAVVVPGVLRDEPGSAPATTVAPDPSASTAPAAVDDEWNAALADALRPLGAALRSLASEADRWSTDQIDDAAFAAVLDDVRPAVESVQAAVAELPPHPSEPLASPLVETMADLYVAAVAAHDGGLAAGEPALAEQYDRLGRRLRILADRVFDRARERTASPVEVGSDVRLVLPAEVPDWDRLELSVGPPLEPADTDRPDDTPLEREERRPSQPESDWRAGVAALDAPTPDDVRDAMGDVDRLGELARRLVAASEALRAVPVPDGDRGRADRVGLGWLIAADAARAGQLAALTGRDRALAETLLATAYRPELAGAIEHA